MCCGSLCNGVDSSGRIEARTGLRMMPTSPRSPLLSNRRLHRIPELQPPGRTFRRPQLQPLLIKRRPTQCQTNPLQPQLMRTEKPPPQWGTPPTKPNSASMGGAFYRSSQFGRGHNRAMDRSTRAKATSSLCNLLRSAKLAYPKEFPSACRSDRRKRFEK